MKHKIKYVLLLAIFMCGLQVDAQEVREELTDFAEVKTFSGVEVRVVPASSNYIEISGYSKEKVKYKVVENRLEIRMSLDNIWSKDNTQITVFAANLEIIDANEGSFVRVDKDLEAETFTFRAQEGAMISANVEANHVISRAISGGNITLDGRAESQKITAHTGGQVNARKLRTDNTEVSTATAGKAEIYATKYVKATAKMGGLIQIYGRPKEVDSKTSLGGKIL